MSQEDSSKKRTHESPSVGPAFSTVRRGAPQDSESNRSNPNDERDSDQREMSFWGHLDELRSRIMKSLLIFFLGFMICYGFSEELMSVLRAPLFEILPKEKQKLYFTGIFENFLTHLKIAGYASVFLFSPFYFYQIWAFISPGLYPKERKYVLPFIVAATVFFVGGAAFAYFILFPFAFKFLVFYGGEADEAILTISSYYSTALKLLLLFGIAFELPVLVSLLGLLGVVNSRMLKANRRVAIIGITVACAMFAPPDALSMLMLMGPLILLYEGSIYVVAWFERKRATRGEGQPRGEPEFSNLNDLKGSGGSREPKLSEEEHPWVGRSR